MAMIRPMRALLLATCLLGCAEPGKRTDVTVSGNKAGSGAGIDNAATGASKATLTRVLVTGNSATGTDLKGGGVFNDGPMTIDQNHTEARECSEEMRQRLDVEALIDK